MGPFYLLEFLFVNHKKEIYHNGIKELKNNIIMEFNERFPKNTIKFSKG